LGGAGYWKQGVSLYTNGRHNLNQFKALHPHIKTGTGCINLRITDEVPEDALRDVIRHAIEHTKPPARDQASMNLLGQRAIAP
jgi:hypothetical protein